MAEGDEIYHLLVSEGPELVIGLVGAIGTDLAFVSDSLQRHLNGVGYSSSEIRISHLLHEIETYAELAAIQDKEQYYDRHMGAGTIFARASRDRTRWLFYPFSSSEICVPVKTSK